MAAGAAHSVMTHQRGGLYWCNIYVVVTSNKSNSEKFKYGERGKLLQSCGVAFSRMSQKCEPAYQPLPMRHMRAAWTGAELPPR